MVYASDCAYVLHVTFYVHVYVYVKRARLRHVTCMFTCTCRITMSYVGVVLLYLRFSTLACTVKVTVTCTFMRHVCVSFTFARYVYVTLGARVTSALL